MGMGLINSVTQEVWTSNFCGETTGIYSQGILNGNMTHTHSLQLTHSKILEQPVHTKVNYSSMYVSWAIFNNKM